VNEPPPTLSTDRLREVLTSVNTPDSMAWSVMMTHAEDTTSAIERALEFDCPPVMAPKATRILRELHAALSRIMEAVPDADAA